MGRLSDTFGRRPLYLAGLTLLAVTTGWCAAAQTVGSFIAARAFSGIGAAGVLSMGNIMTNDLVSIEVRGTFQAYINLFYGGGSACGAAFGGFLCDKLGWRMTFAIQVPVLIALLINAFFTTPGDPGSESCETLGLGNTRRDERFRHRRVRSPHYIRCLSDPRTQPRRQHLPLDTPRGNRISDHRILRRRNSHPRRVPRGESRDATPHAVQQASRQFSLQQLLCADGHEYNPIQRAALLPSRQARNRINIRIPPRRPISRAHHLWRLGRLHHDRFRTYEMAHRRRVAEHAHRRDLLVNYVGQHTDVARNHLPRPVEHRAGPEFPRD
jgi:hypothetical protein